VLEICAEEWKSRTGQGRKTANITGVGSVTYQPSSWPRSAKAALDLYKRRVPVAV
jgi:hypothetical protein